MLATGSMQAAASAPRAAPASAARGAAAARVALAEPRGAALPTQAPATGVLPLPAPSTAQRWASLAPEERAQLPERESGLPLRERLLRNSERFLDTPYLLSPLGEGEGVDPDPTFRLDAVDCLTFVEETIALSLARSQAEVPALLERLRYASEPRYEDRNHLMEAQWLPNNLRKGFLESATRRYGGADVVREVKVLSDLTWSSRTSAALGLPRARQPRGSFALDVIPLAQVMAHARELPSGTLLVVVREDKPLMPTRVTHLGFVVQKKRRTYLRHAARNGYGHVVDEDLATFLTRNSKYTRWRVTGVSLYEVRVPSDAASPSQTAVRAAP
nr:MULTISPECIES: N-acetylmuramoyl-L-alanine amidase-like domain-containing protein [Myxococcaceae]